MPRAIGLCALALAAALTAAADNYPRQPGIDVQHYRFALTLSDDTDAIEGEAAITIRFVREGVARFTLDLASAANGKGMTVGSVASAGAPVKFTHTADRLTIELAAAPKAGERREFAVVYRGIPAGGLHAVKNIHGERTFFSSNWPDLAHQWLPTVDHPYDKATSEFVVTAPERYQVVANGALEEEIDLPGGRRLTHWRESVPIATWLCQLGVAQFSSRHYGWAAGVPLETWVFPQDRDAGRATFDEPALQAIEFFAEGIGPYPYEKLASVQAAGMSGGMEVASAIFYGEKSVTGRPAFSLVAHETAHQWWGDSVTENDWDDVWLSEGFATYFALLATEHYQGSGSFVAGLTRSRASIFRAEERQPGVAVVQNKPWKGIPNRIVYEKGGWVLHMLRAEIGTVKFWAGMREYYRRYRDANASTADFRAVMEEVSGADLGWFFRQWLYRAGSPKLRGEWSYDRAAGQVAIALEQQQPGDAYILPLEVALRVPEGQPTTVKIRLTEKRQRFLIPSPARPRAVDLDPGTWALIDARPLARDDPSAHNDR